MKKYFPIVIVLFAFHSQKNIHPGVNIKEPLPLSQNNGASVKEVGNDTLDYLTKKFVDRKNLYINKELNVLLNDLSIPVKQYYYSTNFKKANISESVGLVFYNRSEIDQKHQQHANPMIINIIWKTPLPLTDGFDAFTVAHCAWTEEVKNYYGKQIAGDIKISPTPDIQ
jgi:hypothetical protein